MAKDKATQKPQYGDVVARLQEIVEGLEGGELGLEESLERFAEGVALVKQGEGLLGDAEKRIEQLLSEDGKTAPLSSAEAAPAEKHEKPAPKAAKKAAPVDEDDDVPF